MGNEEVYALISKRIRILTLTLVICFALLSFGMGQQQTSISISCSVTISFKRSYVCGNYNSTHYYAQNNATGTYELISTDASQTISYALSKLTPGRTWQETIVIKGNWTIGTTITMSQANVLLDCRQATLTSTTSILLQVQTSGVTILGGHWIGQAAGISMSAIRFVTRSATYCTVDGINAENFTGVSGNMPGAIWGAYDSSHITIQNCLVHDNGAYNYNIDFGNLGYNSIINCHLYNSGAAVFISDGCPYNQILGCEFYGWHSTGGHAIYLDGSGTSIGHNSVSGCTFHDPLGGAGVQIKCQNNSIYNNTFYNFPNVADGAVGLSIYSQYSPSYANDNDIYNNSFTNMVYAIWIGHDAQAYPTLRNKIHDNTFSNITDCILLNPWSAVNWTNDTWIYYNKFVACTNIIPVTTFSPPNYVANTVVAYNVFDRIVTGLAFETQYQNTMVYGNTGLADFNVPPVKTIPQR